MWIIIRNFAQKNIFMRVLIINTSERIGGAAIAAIRLMHALKKANVSVKMLVRDKQTDYLTVVSVGSSWKHTLHFLWERLCIFVANGFSRKNLFLVDIANAGTDITSCADFKRADVIHLHWVNQGFLSMRGLREILHSGKPVVVTMHDQWYFTGVCHYSDGCEKYKTQCGQCPQMRGALLGDYARSVFEKKRGMYQDAPVTFVGCSQWMAGLAKSSALTQGHKVVSVPNAIDTDLFRPLDKAEARRMFGLPERSRLILFGCQRITDERKGFRYMAEALSMIKDRRGGSMDMTLVVVGGKADAVKTMVPVDTVSVSYVSDPHKLAQLYNAVDVYVTPSLQDNLPNTIMEAMACGTPCVGFNAGGIPEMIDHKVNGYVAGYKDAADFAEGILWTLSTGTEQLGKAARDKVMRSYSEDVVAKKYMEVYEG